MLPYAHVNPRSLGSGQRTNLHKYSLRAPDNIRHYLSARSRPGCDRAVVVSQKTDSAAGVALSFPHETGMEIRSPPYVGQQETTDSILKRENPLVQ